MLKFKAQQLLRKDALHQTITARDLAQFIGTASAAAVAIPPGPPFHRSLQASKHHSQKQEGEAKQPSTPNKLQQGGAGMMKRSGKSMEPSKPGSSDQLDKDNFRCLNLDWEAVCRGVTTGGSWSQDKTFYHINYLEILAAFLALFSFTKDLLHPLTVYLYMENTLAVCYLNRKERQHLHLSTILPRRPGNGACLGEFH